MELLKHKKELMLAVKCFLFLGITFLMINCNSLKKVETSNNYKIEVFKSNDNSTYLNLQTFLHENRKEKYYAVYRINNVIFSETDLNNLTINVLPGKFKIESGLIGKEWISLNDFEVKRGDSIVMSFFLKDIKDPLY